MSATKNFSIVPGDTLVIVFEHETSMSGYSATFTLKSVNGTELLTGTTTGESPRLVVSGNNITLTVPHTVTADIMEGGKYQLTTVSPAGVRSTTFQGYGQLDTFGGDSGEETDGVISRPIADFSGVGLLEVENTWTAPQHFADAISADEITASDGTLAIGQIGDVVTVTGLTGSAAQLTQIPAAQLTGTVPASLVHTSPFIVRQSGGTPSDQVEISHNGASAILSNKNAIGGSTAKFVFQGNNTNLTDIDCATITCTNVNASNSLTAVNMGASSIECESYFYDGACDFTASDDVVILSNNGSVKIGNRIILNRTTVNIPEDTPIQMVASDGPILAPADTEYSSGTIKMPSDSAIGMTYYITNVRESSFTLSVVDALDNPIGYLTYGQLGILIYSGVAWHMWVANPAGV